MSDKPFAAAADQNKDAILDVLCKELQAGDKVLELGSGTGQHACHFASRLPAVQWQPSELASMLDGIRRWLQDAAQPNLLPPLELDVRSDPWPDCDATVCYSANTFHIIAESAIEAVFRGCARILPDGGTVMVYGPFRRGGRHTAPSNARFDQMLRAGDPQAGVRDIGELDQSAARHQFGPARLIEMPSNNFIAVWVKSVSLQAPG